MDRPIVSEFDLKMMECCVELSKTASAYGEFPFASLVCRGEIVVSEAINHVDRDTDVTRHAELMAVSEKVPRTRMPNKHLSPGLALAVRWTEFVR